MAQLYFGADPSRLGQDSLAGDARALFLKVFSGMTMAAFNEKNVTMGRHEVRTISSGKSAQFPRFGRATAKYHTPGENLLTTGVDTTAPADGVADVSKYLTKIPHGEKVISIDDLLTASTFIANLDEAMNHYDVRSQYALELGYALSEAADKNILRTIIAGARTTTNVFGTAAANAAAQAADRFLGGVICVDGTATGNQIVTSETAGSGTGADQLIAGLFKAAELMDAKNVPEFDRFAALRPQQYYQLINENKDAINRDYNPEGNGSLARGEVISVAGIQILKSNHVPSTDESSGTLTSDAGIQNDVFGGSGVGYGANFAATIGVVFQRSAVATTKLLDLAMEMEYLIAHQGNLAVAKYAMGHGVLREECCYELVDNAAPVGSN